jgi:hypothetical protein
MKKHLLTTFLILSGIRLYAQKVELSVVANTGLFNFSGASSTTNTYIGNGFIVTDNPYGSQKTFSYEVALQAQYVGKCGFIVGLQTGYDILRSKTEINEQVSYIFATPSPSYAMYQGPPTFTGATYLQDKSINLSPYLGYRFSLKNIQLDILPGADIGLNINSYDKGNATNEYGGTVYTTDLKRPKEPTDIRLKMGTVLYFKRLGINASYAYGLTDYNKNMTGDGTYNTKSRFIRFGVSYRIF